MSMVCGPIKSITNLNKHKTPGNPFNLSHSVFQELLTFIKNIFFFII